MSTRLFHLAAPVVLSLGLGVAPTVHAASFSLDDNPRMPLGGPPGFGQGAEDPYGLAPPAVAGVGPSPSIVIGPGAGDGAIYSPGPGMPALQHPGPNGSYVDSLSSNHQDNGADIQLDFSIDRVSGGLPGSASAAETALGQQPGDIYSTTRTFTSPGAFAGTLLGGGYVGILPTVGPLGSNTLNVDDSTLGLTCFGAAGATCPPAGIPAPPPGIGTHDNVDGFDWQVFDTNRDGIFDVDGYFTIYPDEAVNVNQTPGTNASPAHIYAVAAGDPGATPSLPYASAAMLGLDPFDDSIDGLVMFDNDLTPTSLGQGGPGSVQRVTDYALFSLSPGSASLALFGLSSADIFFTDFSGSFALYASAANLGLLGMPGGTPFAGDNVDALEISQSGVPEPGVLVLMGLGLSALWLRRGPQR